MKRTIAFSIGSLAILLFSLARLHAQSLERPVPFKLSAKDTTLSPYLPELEPGPAGKHGALGLDTNGHIIAADGTRLRFFGTEIEYNANFIADSDAKVFALRLRKLGFNALRLTYNDYYGYNDYGLVDTYDSLGNFVTTSYKPNWTQIAHLDTLIYELKQAGVYTILTLNSIHQFGTGDGIYNIDSLNYYYNLLPYTEPRAASLEEAWAHTLLTHLNPLTGTTYAKENAIAVVNLTYNNTLYFYWQLDRLNFADDADVAPRGKYTVSYYQSRQLDTLYSQYLQTKYHSDAALNAAWQGNPDLSKANLMDNGSFENELSTSWSFTAQNGATAAFVDADGGVDSAIYKKIIVASVGPNPTAGNIYAFNFNPVTICGKDSLYELTFWAKSPYNASRPTQFTRPLYLYISQYGGNANFSNTITIDTGWKEYSIVFRATYVGAQEVYVFMGQSLGDVWLDAFSLHHKAEIGLMAGESMGNASVLRLLTTTVANFPLQRVRDQVMFMDSLQMTFYERMLHLIKDTLQYTGLVNCTQVNYWGLPPDEYANSLGDQTEGEVAWDYFTSRPGKTYSDSAWMMQNTAELKATYGGNLGYYVPANSVAGKAFFCTRSALSVNQNAAEQMFLTPAYAGYQDWDGFFITPFASNRGEIFADHIFNPFAGPDESYNSYAITANSAVLALAPAASAMFLHGMVAPASYSQNVEHDPDDVWLTPIVTSGRGPWGVDGYLDPNIITSIKVRQKFNSPVHTVAAQYAYDTDTSEKKSLDNDILWDQTNGLFTINAPKVNGAAGFFGTDTFALPSIKFSRHDNDRDMFALYYISLDSLQLDSSERSLLTISPRVQNTGWHWIDSLGIDTGWGHAPMLMNGQRLSISIKSNFDTVAIYPLDSMGRFTRQPGTGEPVFIIATKPSSSAWASNIALDQTKTPSVWYYIHKYGHNTAGVAEAESPAASISLVPNPASSSTTLSINSAGAGRVSADVFDDLGRKLMTIAANEPIENARVIEVNTSSLRSGHYIVRVSLPGNTESVSLNVLR